MQVQVEKQVMVIVIVVRRGCPIPIGSARDQGDFNCVEDTETDTKKKS